MSGPVLKKESKTLTDFADQKVMKKWILTSLFISLTAPNYSFGQLESGGLDYSTPNVNTWTGREPVGRYIQKSKAKKSKRKIASTKASLLIPSTFKDQSQGQGNVGQRLPAALDAETPSPATATATSTLSPPSQPVVQPTPALQKETISGKVRDIVLGGDQTSLESYRDVLDLQDMRRNLFEITLATGYMYNSSSSPYFFKDYNDSGPTVDLAADLWLSPFLGVNAEYETTLLNELSDSPTQNVYVSSTQTWFDFGVKLRRFFGMNSSSPSFTLGLRYASYSLSVPASSNSRIQVKNSGPELDLDFALPLGRDTFWTMGVLFQPLDSLSESSGSSIRSGNGNQTIGAGLELGAEYRFSRQMCGFIKFKSLLYKTDFSGPANTVDPVSGTTPSSVPVTNMFYFLNIGMRLGH